MQSFYSFYHYTPFLNGFRILTLVILALFSSMARRGRNEKISPLHTSVAHLHIRQSRQVLSPGAKARIEVQGMRLSLDPAYCAITPIQGPSRCHLVLRGNDRRRMTAHPQLPRQHVRRRVCMSRLRVLVLQTRQERTPIMSRKRELFMILDLAD